jgi:CubicO group peptidase (beta-lactamase class C family)
MNDSFSRGIGFRVDQAINQAIEERRLVGAVVFIGVGGKLVYRRAAGLADREQRRPMTEDKIFLIASVTKPIVTAAAMRLIELGELSVTDPVTRWLPEFTPRLETGETPPITIHHLLTHSAGLTYKFFQPDDGPYRRLGVSDGLDAAGPSLSENVRRIAAAPLTYRPGTKWGYSLSIDVLGAVLEKVRGSELPQVIADLVTEPLAMYDTGFRVSDIARLVRHYADAKPEPRPIGDPDRVPFRDAVVEFSPGRIFDPRAYPSAGAGMAGTALEVFRLLDTLTQGGGKLLKRETVELMMKAHVGIDAQVQGPGWGFGYGGAILGDPGLAQSPQSRGTMEWGGAYGHFWFVDREKQITALALTNTTFEGMAGKFTSDLRRAVYG